MRALAKRRKINLKGNKNKDKIINIISAHFSQIKTSKIPFKVLDERLNIIENDLGYINVSIWFKDKPELLARCMNSKEFQEFAAEHIKREPNSILVQRGDDNAVFFTAYCVCFCCYILKSRTVL
jgi:hypothetical protein